MSATKELRELLDQRGVSWMPSAWNPKHETYYQTDNGVGVVASEVNGKVMMRFESRITPEQAIAATAGRETCHDIGDERIFHCSACGFGFSDVYLSDEAYFFDDDGEQIEPWPPFCPNCGRRVVDE